MDRPMPMTPFRRWHRRWRWRAVSALATLLRVQIVPDDDWHFNFRWETTSHGVGESCSDEPVGAGIT